MPRAIDHLSKDVIEELAELSMKLASNAETRKDYLKAVKKIDPAKRFPTHEVDELRAELAETREREKEERQIEEQRKATEARLNAQRSALVGKGYTDDQLKEVESVMQKYGLADYEAGADLYQARKPATAPDAPTGTWEFPTIAGLIENPTKAARDEAYRTITELKRGRAA